MHLAIRRARVRTGPAPSFDGLFVQGVNVTAASSADLAHADDEENASRPVDPAAVPPRGHDAEPASSPGAALPLRGSAGRRIRRLPIALLVDRRPLRYVFPGLVLAVRRPRAVEVRSRAQPRVPAQPAPAVQPVPGVGPEALSRPRGHGVPVDLSRPGADAD